MSQLELRHASVHRGGRTILDSVSLSLSGGEFIALIGPNGSGKSTLLRAMAGLQDTTPRNAARIDGDALWDMRRQHVARRIAFVPQETHLAFPFTVSEVVSMGRYARRGRFERETPADQRAVAVALAMCDVGHLSHRAVDSLSVGERQRVLIARGLAVEPDFILLDEPTASLDIEHTLQIYALCRELAAKGCGVVVSSHDLNAVTQSSTKVAVLHEGRLLAVGMHDVLEPALIHQVFRASAERIRASDGSVHYVFGALPLEKLPTEQDVGPMV